MNVLLLIFNFFYKYCTQTLHKDSVLLKNYKVIPGHHYLRHGGKFVFFPSRCHPVTFFFPCSVLSTIGVRSRSPLIVLSVTSLFLSQGYHFLEYWGRGVLIVCYYSRISFRIALWGGEENLIQWIQEANKSFPTTNTFCTQHDVKQTCISSFSGSCLWQLFKILDKVLDIHVCVLGGRITLEQKYNAKNKLSSFYTWSQSVFSNFALSNVAVLVVI